MGRQIGTFDPSNLRDCSEKARKEAATIRDSQSHEKYPAYATDLIQAQFYLDRAIRKMNEIERRLNK